MLAGVQSFLRTIVKSGLFDKAQLEAILRTIPRSEREDPERLASHLVRTGLLSRFQAKKLLSGTSLGLVLGPYQILAPIGRGGMSAVYLARDARTRVLIALK